MQVKECKSWIPGDIKKLRDMDKDLYQNMIDRFGDKKWVLKVNEAEDGSWSEWKRNDS